MRGKRSGSVKTVSKVIVKKKKVTIVFDDGEKIVLSQNSFAEFVIYAGKAISASEYKKILEFANIDTGYNYALKLLAKENYSEYELRGKLIYKGIEKEGQRKIIKKLKSLGMIDDALYARTFADDVAALRLLGEERIRYELSEKGIPDSIISELDFPEEKEIAKAEKYLATLDRKYAKSANSVKRIKILKALVAKGFSSKVSSIVSSKITKESIEEDMAKVQKAYDAVKNKYAKKHSGYELKRRIIASLLSKGYEYDQIKELIEGDENL